MTGFAREPGSSKEHTRQCVTKPCERKQRRREFTSFLFDIPLSGLPSSPELNRATHLLDDVGGGMVGEIRKEVHNATKKKGAIPPPPDEGGPDTTASEPSGERRYRRNLHIR